jgi:hypothetical protein
MSTLSQFSGGGIKSIQRGTITMSIANAVSTMTATITAVDTAKTMLNYCGVSDGQQAGFPGTFVGVRIALTSSTQVTASSPFGFASYPATVSYEVIEYF